ncbi:MAG: hypothetical protein WCD11_13200 [Solirubrobacteraceae bacterium]
MIAIDGEQSCACSSRRDRNATVAVAASIGVRCRRPIAELCAPNNRRLLPADRRLAYALK